jgi:acyl-homoserine-lactone acylase
VTWVPEIDAVDLLAYHHDLAMVATTRPLLAAIATAAPPQPGDAPAAGTPQVPASPVVGGTAWALGSGATRAGVDPADDRAPAAMLVATSEFPWEGELALWENHLTIPGELDVYGLSLIGLPGVLSGFTDALAWTRLASPATATVLVTVDLDGDDPTAYRNGDEVESMVPRSVSVAVLGADGATTTEESTVWFTRHGPVVDLPGVGWGPERAVAVADVSLANPVLVDEVLDTNRAGSADELVATHRTRMASGWLATVAVTATGQATYTNPAGVPALADGAMVDPGSSDDPLVLAAAQSGAVVVDGTATPGLWDANDASVSPVLVDGDRLARVVVDDWLVATAGTTAWSSGGELVATGAFPVGAGTTPGPQLVGLVRLVAGLVADATEEGRPLGPDDVIDVLATNEGTLSGVLRDQVVERCRAAGKVPVEAGTTASGYELWPAQEVDLSPVCNLLDRWEGRWNGEDQAPAVWTEFLSAFDPGELTGPGRLLAGAWDPTNLLAVPPGLAEAPVRGPDPVAVALARAAKSVEAAGFDIDDFWRDQFWTRRDDVAIGLRGSTGLDGTVLVGRPAGPSSSLSPAAALPVLVNPDSGLRIGGYQVRGGTSALMVVAFTPDGPDATALLVHGQSGDPASPYWADQAYRYSDLAWRGVRTDPDDIAGAGERSVSLRVPRLP